MSPKLRSQLTSICTEASVPGSASSSTVIAPTVASGSVLPRIVSANRANNRYGVKLIRDSLRGDSLANSIRLDGQIAYARANGPLDRIRNRSCRRSLRGLPRSERRQLGSVDQLHLDGRDLGE